MFSQILHVGVQFPKSNLLEVIEAAANEINLNLSTIANPGPKDDLDVIQAELESNMNTFLYILVIFTKVRQDLTQEENFRAMQQVYEVVSLDPRARSGVSLLHLAVSSETLVDDFHTSDIVHFPSACATKLLLDAGANPGAMDTDRNTPLHRIVVYQRIVSDFITIHAIISSLIEVKYS